jgi:predicted nucleic acid-binding protein
VAGARGLLNAIRAEGFGAFVADTAPVVYHLEDTAAPRLTLACAELFAAVEEGELECLVSSVTVAELLITPFRGSPEAVITVDAFLRQPHVYVAPAGERIARTGAQLVAKRLVNRLADALVVATAFALELPLVTGDRRLARAAVVPTFLVADYAP